MHCNKVSLQALLDCFDNDLDNNTESTQEKRRVNTDPFLHRIYTIGLYTV